MTGREGGRGGREGGREAGEGGSRGGGGKWEGGEGGQPATTVQCKNSGDSQKKLKRSIETT